MFPKSSSALTDPGQTETVNATSRLYRSLAERFANVVRDNLGARLTCIVLYGSVARGTARPDSDIDLFVIAGESDEDKEPLWDQVLDLEQTFWNDQEVAALRAQGYRASVEAYVVSKAQARRGLPIYLDMALDAIVLHDPENFFSRRIDQVKQRMVELRSRREWLSQDTYIWQLKTDAEPGEVISLPYVEEIQR
jgi:predicted nucleotidyltransferase